MKIGELQDGQVVRARWGRAGEEDVNWGPWKDVPLYIQRHKDRVTCIALKDINWAEYGPDDFNPDYANPKFGVFLAEDYYLQIEGLTR